MEGDEERRKGRERIEGQVSPRFWATAPTLVAAPPGGEEAGLKKPSQSDAVVRMTQAGRPA
jgi:hypothetical protein